MAFDTEQVELVGDETTGNLARAVVFAAVTAATAPMSLTHPLAPNVPITLQTVWVYLAGVVLGPVWAGVAFVLYALAGLVGLPVFEGGGGLGYMLGPTGGYIVGFVAAAVLIGLLVHGWDSLARPTEVSPVRVAAALVAGTAVIYAFGAAWLVAGLGLSPSKAVATGVLPFVPIAGVKIAGTLGVINSDAVVAR